MLEIKYDFGLTVRVDHYGGIHTEYDFEDVWFPGINSDDIEDESAFNTLENTMERFITEGFRLGGEEFLRNPAFVAGLQLNYEVLKEIAEEYPDLDDDEEEVEWVGGPL